MRDYEVPPELPLPAPYRRGDLVWVQGMEYRCRYLRPADWPGYSLVYDAFTGPSVEIVADTRLSGAQQGGDPGVP